MNHQRLYRYDMRVHKIMVSRVRCLWFVTVPFVVYLLIVSEVPEWRTGELVLLVFVAFMYLKLSATLKNVSMKIKYDHDSSIQA
jgi:hypothetical protein